MAKSDSSKSENQIIADIKAGNIAPIYFLTGEETYYIDTLSDFFENEALPPEVRDFNQLVVYGRDSSMRAVIDAAKQYPINSNHQLILVKEAQDIALREWEILPAYLAQPTPSTILVMCYRNKKLDKRSKVYSAIKKYGVVYERSKLYDSDVPTWIANYCKQNNRAITEKASRLLTEAIGNNLSKLSNELQKLFIIVPENDTIKDSAIERNIGISKDYNIFELINAIGRKDVVTCNKIVNYFGDNPKAVSIPAIVANLYPFFVKVMIYHQLADKATAASALGVNPYFVKDYATAARNYTIGKLATCIKYLYETDRRSKGIGSNSTITRESELLKEMIFKIIH